MATVAAHTGIVETGRLFFLLLAPEEVTASSAFSDIGQDYQMAENGFVKPFPFAHNSRCLVDARRGRQNRTVLVRRRRQGTGG